MAGGSSRLQPGRYQEGPALTRPSVREVAGIKFLWDGVTYLTRDDARQALEAYKKDGFEVHMFLEEDHYLVYTRKLVTAASASAAQETS